MPATTLNPRQQIRDALMFIRHYQHHPDCRCGLYRDPDGEPFCTSRQVSWNRAIDALIDQCRVL